MGVSAFISVRPERRLSKPFLESHPRCFLLSLTLHISEESVWASPFIGRLNDLLKKATMTGGRGWEAGGGRWLELFCAAPFTSTADCAIHRRGGELGSSPRNQHATAAPVSPALVTALALVAKLSPSPCSGNRPGLWAGADPWLQ